MPQLNPDPDLPPAEREVEAALARVRPAAVSINPSDALFEAGRLTGARSARRQVHLWRAAAAILLAGGVAAFAVRPAPKVVQTERTVFVQVPVDPSEVESPAAPVQTAADQRSSAFSPAPESMFSLRQVALEKGIDRLPHAAASGTSISIRVRDLKLP